MRSPRRRGRRGENNEVAREPFRFEEQVGTAFGVLAYGARSRAVRTVAERRHGWEFDLASFEFSASNALAISCPWIEKVVPSAVTAGRSAP
ncbi:hypothetical protein [Streptomyces mexicanus]|uniref:hypothetical protein n=1 Tax=Streptomyces mexicanus TaxID=178566 RepID=UPI0036533457